MNIPAKKNDEETDNAVAPVAGTDAILGALESLDPRLSAEEKAAKSRNRAYDSFLRTFKEKERDEKIKKLEALTSTTIPGQLVFTRNEMGQYFFMGKPLALDQNTIYYNVFDILFTQHNADGFVSYEAIERELRKRGASPARDPFKRIQNAIGTHGHQGFFRYATINGQKIKNRDRTGNPYVVVLRGEGLKFNNPPYA